MAEWQHSMHMQTYNMVAITNRGVLLRARERPRASHFVAELMFGYYARANLGYNRQNELLLLR